MARELIVAIVLSTILTLVATSGNESACTDPCGTNQGCNNETGLCQACKDICPDSKLCHVQECNGNVSHMQTEDTDSEHRMGHHTTVIGLNFILAMVGSGIILITGAFVFAKYPLGCGDKAPIGYGAVDGDIMAGPTTTKMPTPTIVIMKNDGNAGLPEVTTEVELLKLENEDFNCTSSV